MHPAGVALQGGGGLAAGRRPTAAPSRRGRRWPAGRRRARTPPRVTPPVWPSRVAGRLAGGRRPTAAPSRRRRRWPAGGRRARTPPRAPRRCGPRGCAVGRPVAASHSRTVPSSPALASRRAVGRERDRRTPSRCGPRGWRSSCAAGRRPTAAPSRRRRRWPAGAPSGENATAAHRAGVALQGARSSCAAGRVPQPHRPVVAGAGQAAGRRARTPPRAPSRCGPRGSAVGPAAGGVPQPHRPVVAGAGQAAGRRARTPPRVHRAGVALEGARSGWPLAGVPQPHRPVVAGAGQPAARRARTPPRAPRRCGPRAVAVGLAGGRVPQPHRPVVAGAGQPAARRARTPRAHPAGVALEGGGGLRRWPRPTAAPSRRRRRWPAGWPSGENATALTPPVWPSQGGGRAAPLAGVPQPHRPVVAGAGQPAGRRARTPPRAPAPVWPSSVAVGWPLAASHSRTVPSSPALASRCAVGRERHRDHPAGVALEDALRGRLERVGRPQRGDEVRRRAAGAERVGVDRRRRVVGAAGERGGEVAERAWPANRCPDWVNRRSSQSIAGSVGMQLGGLAQVGLGGVRAAAEAAHGQVGEVADRRRRSPAASPAPRRW